jgi:hypothetical protein
MEILETRKLLAALPLVHQADLEYVGAFKVPQGRISNDGQGTFQYGGTAPAYNPANNSLFLVGHDWDQNIAEISIPPLVNSNQLGSLNTASVLQPFTSIQYRVPNWSLTGNTKVGGLEVVGDELVGTFYEYYDGDANAVDSHFKLSSLNLNSASAGGLYQVGNAGGGFVGGYMTAVPEEWQDALGAPYLTGQAALSIIGRTSAGPAAFGFDPDDLGNSTAPVETYVNYPLSNPLAPETTGNSLFNLTTRIDGVAFPPDTSSVIFFGSHGLGQYCYGEASDCNDPYNTSKGTHVVGGQYEYQAWAYDVEDFIDVKNGLKQSWEIQPYDVWNFDLPFGSGYRTIGGVTFDAQSGRLYVSQLSADGADRHPVIHAFDFATETGTTIPAPVISNVQSLNTTTDSAEIRWNTDLPADSLVEYGTTNSLGSFSPIGTAMVTSHAVSLNNLTPDTTYRYRVTSRNVDGEATVSALRTFTTEAIIAVDVDPPVISNVQSSAASNQASITWTTNELTDAIVEYGLDTSHSDSTSLKSQLTTNHTATISGLQPDTTYHFQVKSRDAAGNLATSASFSFITTAIDTPTASDSYSYSNPQPLPALDPSRTVNVNSVSQLINAINNLQSGQTIAIAAGVYDLNGATDALYVPQGISDWAIRGATGDRDDVIIRGAGMSGSVRFGFWIGNSSRGTIADLTIDGVREHGIIANPGAHDILYHGLRIIDSGDQFIKSNPASNGSGNDRGIVEYSIFEYRSTSNNNYTNGVDVHGGDDWIVQYNLFKNILSPVGQALAGPSVLFWNGSTNTTVDGNTFVNTARGISLGLIDRDGGFDHQGGVIKNNMFYRDAGLASAFDVPIYVSDSPGTDIFHNTVLDLGNYPNSIEYRFASTTNGEIANNLINGLIWSRDGASAVESGNVSSATESMFINAAAGDLHLRESATVAIDQGAVIPGITRDFDGQSRDGQPDIGADERYTADSPVNLPPQILNQTLSIAENSALGSLVGTVSANDPEGSPLTYRLVSGNTQNAFSINSDSGILRVNNSLALDYETRSQFDVVVEVADSDGLTNSATIRINVTDVDEVVDLPPVIADQAFSIAEDASNGDLVDTVVANDPESNPLSYRVVSGNINNVFAINPNSGAIRVNNANALDFEQQAQFNLLVEVTDVTGLTASATVTINVTDVDETPATGGLVSRFQFEEWKGNRTYDQAGREGVISGARARRAKFGRGLEFDGYNDFVTVADDDALDLTTQMTLSMWVYPKSQSDWQSGIVKEIEGGLAYGLYVSNDQSLPAVYINLGDGYLNATGRTPLPRYQWSHLAATFNGSELKLFVNGQQVSQLNALGSLVTSDSPLRFGGNSIAGHHFRGRMDEVQIYDSVLSTSEISSLASSSSGTLATSRSTSDVNGDGEVTALDALFVMNRLAISSNSAEGETLGTSEYFVDVNGDQMMTALDALQIINTISRASQYDSGSLADTADPSSLPSLEENDELLTLLADDVSDQWS